MELFWELHSGLPQEGPGDDDSTRRALSLIDDLPDSPRILDVGCGPGRQTIALAKATAGQITGIDTHQPFLDDLLRRAKNAGVADRITTRNCPMADMDFEEGRFDLIWSEGAVYIMGFQNGLENWRRFLRPGGAMAVTELSWLTDDPVDEIKQFWAGEYPAMKTVEQNLAIIRDAGYSPIGHFTLPDSAWTEGYYGPLEKRIAEMRDKYAGDAKAQAFLDESQEEIEVFRKYSNTYGYEFYLMRRPD